MADNPGSIYESPAYLAFIRGGDFAIEEAARQAARKQSATKAALGLNIPELEEAGDLQQEQIAGAAEARGMGRSGQRMLDQDVAARKNQRDISRMYLNAADQVGSSAEALSQKVADIQMRAGELGYDVGGKLDYNAKLGGLTKKYGVSDGSYAADDETYGMGAE